MEGSEDGRVDGPSTAPPHPPGNPLASGAAQQPAAPLPSQAAQPTVVSAIATPALQPLVIPRDWTPSHQRVYTGGLERNEAERQIDTIYVINYPPPGSHARNIIDTMVPQRVLLIKPPRSANHAAELVYNVKEKNKRRYGEANVGYIYGQEAPESCTRCAKGGGRYGYCITIADNAGNPYFSGACMSCRAQDATRQCSLAHPPPVRRRTGGGGGGNNGEGSSGNGGNNGEGSGGNGGEVAGLSTGPFSSASNTVTQELNKDVVMEDDENRGTATFDNTQYAPNNSSSAELSSQITPGSSSAHSTGISHGLNLGPQAAPEDAANSNLRGRAVYWNHVLDSRAAS